MKLKILTLLAFLLCCTAMRADTEDEIIQLEAEMLRYFATAERSNFIKVTNRLMDVCQEAGNERLYFEAWGNQAIYEATQQNYKEALSIAQNILNYARDNNSTFGEYMAIHAKAEVLLQKQDYSAAEKEFLNAVDFRHRHYPNESAAEDLQELMKIANHRKDGKAGAAYARQILVEPNVAPIHKGRALYRLSQMAFKQNNVEEFNRIYGEMMKLKEAEGISPLRPLVEVNHCIINGDYEQALALADELEPEDCAERKAVIYHRMGDDANAYKYMQVYKQISDSITLVSHGNVVASCYVQMNNDRLQLEQHLLERQNNRLRNNLYMFLVIVAFAVMLYMLISRRRLLKLLRRDYQQMQYQKNDAERALDDLNELSFFESRTELPLNETIKVNRLCDRIATATQAHCYKGVTTILQTEVDDDFELRTNADAIKKLLTHLMNYSARFTNKGWVVLRAADDGNNILFSVTDTSAGLGKKADTSIIGMFSEQGNKVRYVGMNFNICQSITRLLHGRIWHDTEYTNGTRFLFVVPKEPIAA